MQETISRTFSTLSWQNGSISIEVKAKALPFSTYENLRDANRNEINVQVKRPLGY